MKLFKVIIFLGAFLPLSIHAFSYKEIRATAQTNNGEVFSLNNNSAIQRLHSNQRNRTAEVLNFHAGKYGEPIDLLSFGNELVVITKKYQSKHIVRFNPQDSATSVIGTRFNIKDVAVIGDWLFILSPEGNVSKKNLNTKEWVKLFENKEWADVTKMVGVGPRLATLRESGILEYVEQDDLARTFKFGSGFSGDFQMLSLDDENLILISPREPSKVYVKNLLTKSQRIAGAFVSRMQIDTKKLYKARGSFYTLPSADF